MGLLSKFFTNCAHPKGGMGRAMLKFMNWCHAPLTNWGLSFVEIKDGWTMLLTSTTCSKQPMPRRRELKEKVAYELENGEIIYVPE